MSTAGLPVANKTLQNPPPPQTVSRHLGASGLLSDQVRGFATSCKAPAGCDSVLSRLTCTADSARYRRRPGSPGAGEDLDSTTVAKDSPPDLMESSSAIRNSDRSGPAARRLRVAFVMEQILGHTTWSQNLRAAVTQMDDMVDARWILTQLYQQGGTVERLPAVSPLIKASMRGLLDTRRGLRGWRPDVLFFNTQKPAAFCQLQMLRTPTILMTDVTPAQYDRLAGPYDHDVNTYPLVRTTKHLANVLNFRLARAIVPWSSWAAKSLQSEYGVPSERVHIIPPGVDTDRWRPARGTRPDGPVKLLFVGGHFERKGGRLLLEVFRGKGLAERAELHIVTRDSVEHEQGVVVHRDVENNDETLLRLYQHADLFVLPTLADCFSIASIEAMATGLPVITTNVGGIPDIVEHGRSGYLLAAGDGQRLGEALDQLVNDADLTKQMAQSARDRAVAHFDARVSAGRIADIARVVAQERRFGARSVASASSRPSLVDHE